MTASIVSIQPARELLADYRACRRDPAGVRHGQTIVRYHDRDIQLDVRDAARWQRVPNGWSPLGYSTQLVPSGGLKIDAALPLPAWGGSYYSGRYNARLKPNWTEAQFERAVDRLMRQACIEIHRREYAEVIWRVEQRIFKDAEGNHSAAFVAAVTAEEKRLGRNSDYSTMTIEDAQHWDNWLGQYLLDHPEDRKR